jgi:CelD/BcsL family acetyltransferase involved in cellulose biosynthesis
METFWPEFERHMFHYWIKECDVILINGLRSASLPKSHTYPKVGSAPWIDLSSSTSLVDLLRKSGKKLRQNVRYQIRRLQKEGDLFLRIFKIDETKAAKDALKDLLKTRAERWPEAYNLPGFFKSIIEHVLPTGFLHFSELQLNSQPISWVFGFIYKKRFYYYIPLLRAEMANYSPGKVHLAMLIEEAIAADIEVFDLMKGVEPYKLKWTKNVSNLFSLELKGHGIRSDAIQVWQKQIRPQVLKVKRKVMNVR